MRWRDTKQGRITAKKQKPIKIPPFTISSPINRIKAFITDTFMLMMPLLYLVIYLIMGSRAEFAENMIAGWAYIFVPHFLIIIMFYFFKGQTPGYRAYDIKLVDTNMQKPSLGKLVIRYIAFIFSIVFITGVVLCFMRKDKRNLHDLLSGTMPIQIEK